VDTPGGKVCILGSTGLGYTLFVPELSQYTFTGSWSSRSVTIVAPPFCWSLFSLFKCCLQSLLVSLCLMSTIFFPFPSLTKCPFRENMPPVIFLFFPGTLACLLACPVLPNRFLHALFRISFFLSRVAVSPGLDTLPSISPVSLRPPSVLAAMSMMNRRHYVTQIDSAALRDEQLHLIPHQRQLYTDVILTSRHDNNRRTNTRSLHYCSVHTVKCHLHGPESLIRSREAENKDGGVMKKVMNILQK